MQCPPTALLLTGMLLSLPSASVFAQEPTAHGAQCPAPAAVHYEAGRYRATAALDAGSGRGEWSSTIQTFKRKPRHLASVLYYGRRTDTARSEGVLVNCTYSLPQGEEVDLAYFDHEAPKTQRNLIVALKHPSYWLLDHPPAPGQEPFYTCTRGAKDCAFEPLRLE